MSLRSPLGKARGLGSAKAGVHHWWMQRVTAVALIFLVIWFVLSVIRAASGGSSIIDELVSPYNAVLMILFIGTSLYHGCLGIQVIIEDYITCSCARPVLIILTKFISIITGIALFLAVLSVHLGSYHKAKFMKQIHTYCIEGVASYNAEKCLEIKKKKWELKAKKYGKWGEFDGKKSYRHHWDDQKKHTK